jgi:hypothetical protein
MKAISKILLIVACLSILISCSGPVPAELVLFDFESDAELDGFHWKCHTLFRLSDEHVSHGTRSLRLELYPSKYPGLAPMLEKDDWKGYSALCFDIYNPAKKEHRISMRIDDREDFPDYENRYNKSFILKPGLNRMSFPLDSLVTTGGNRSLDLKNIYRVLIFMVNPSEKVVLYLDHMRLVS